MLFLYHYNNRRIACTTIQESTREHVKKWILIESAKASWPPSPLLADIAILSKFFLHVLICFFKQEKPKMYDFEDKNSKWKITFQKTQQYVLPINNTLALKWGWRGWLNSYNRCTYVLPSLTTTYCHILT